MKTNQMLIRRMGEFEVTQRTQDGMFDATTLMKQWNSKNGSKKEIKHFLEENKNTQEFIDALISEENLNGRNSAYLKTRGIKGGTWMHPYLFIKFAMWLNPRFEVKVIKFVYDELIKYRNDAGDAYRLLCEAVAKISNKKDVAANIQTTAKALNHICFGMHESMLRNKQGEEAMKDLVALEKYITNLIADGVLTNWTSLYNFLVRKYNEKRVPKVFQQQLQAQ